MHWLSTMRLVLCCSASANDLPSVLCAVQLFGPPIASAVVLLFVVVLVRMECLPASSSRGRPGMQDHTPRSKHEHTGVASGFCNTLVAAWLLPVLS